MVRDAIATHHNDNGFFLSDVKIRNERLVDVLTTWLGHAEIGLAPRMDGQKGYFAWSTFDDRPIDKMIKNLPATVEGGGWLSATDRKRVRAAVVIVRFPKMVEVMLRLIGGMHVPGELSNANPDDLDEGVRNAFNVLRLPDDVRYLDRTYYKGTWVSIPFAFEMWTNNTDPNKNLTRLADNPFVEQLRDAGNRAKDFSVIIRENWFNFQYLQFFAQRFTVQNVFQPDPVWGPRIAEVLRRYLQTWQINPTLYRHVLAVKPLRARTVFAIQGQPASPYVSVDHAEIQEFTPPEVASSPNSRAAINVRGEENPKDAVGAPASLRFERPDIFTVDFDAAYSGRWLKQVVPSRLVETTIPPADHYANLLQGGLPSIAADWSKCRLVSPILYSGYVILMMEFGTDSGDLAREGEIQRRALTYGVEVSAQTAGWPGETNPALIVDLDAREDVARFGLNDGLDVDVIPVNLRALDALATAHARQYYHAQRDRLLGTFVVPGWSPEYRLFGSLSSIAVTLDNRGEMTTTFDATQPPPMPELRSLLPEDVRQAVFNEIPSARNARKTGQP